MEEISLAKKVRAMQKKLAEIRQPYEADLENIAKYVFYRREFFDLKSQQGQSIARTKYDGTANQAANNLVYGFQGNIVSRSIEWIDLEFVNKDLENYEEAMIWLEDWIQYLYEVFKKTNFYDTINDNLTDAIGFGTPCFYCENDDKRNQIVYSERHPIEIYVSLNRYGEYDTVFRRYKMAAREIVKQFNEKNISDAVKNDAEKSQSMYNEHVIIHGVFPNEDKVVGSKMSKDKQYRSVYIEEEASNEDITLSDGGYGENPYIVWAWDRNPTEWYGRSPSHNALPEILTLNQLTKAILEATEKTVNPPMYVPSVGRGKIHNYPGGYYFYENYEKEKHEPIIQGIQLPTSKEERDAIEEKIRGYYFNDFFLILGQLLQKEKTATEVLEIQGEKAAIIGPIIGRYETQFLDPVIERTYQIETEKKRGPEMPPVIEDYMAQKQEEGGQEDDIVIRYIGPLATIQERLYKTTGVTHTLSAIAPIGEMQLANPPVLDNFDFDKMARDVAKTHGASPTHLRSDKEVKKIREERAAREQAMQQAALAKEAADAVPKLGQKEEKGSVLDEIRQGV